MHISNNSNYLTYPVVKPRGGSLISLTLNTAWVSTRLSAMEERISLKVTSCSFSRSCGILFTMYYVVFPCTCNPPRLRILAFSLHFTSLHFTSLHLSSPLTRKGFSSKHQSMVHIVKSTISREVACQWLEAPPYCSTLLNWNCTLNE